MPVDISTDILWRATGHATSTTSVVVTHPDAGGTTAGSTVIVIIRSSGAAGFSRPTGWAGDGAAALAGLYFFRVDDVAAAETSWTFTRSPVAGNSAWWMAEVVNLSVDSLEVLSAGTNGTNATGTTRSTGTTALNAGSNSLQIAVFGSTKAASGDTHSWDSYTNSFTELDDFNPAGVAGQCIAVAAKVVETQGTFDTTATFTTSTGTPATGAALAIYRGADADINAPLAYCTGFEFGTHAGMGPTANAAWGQFPSSLGPIGGALPGTWGTHYRVISGAARNGGYGLEVANTASGHPVVLPELAAGTISLSGSVKPVSGSGTPMAVFLDPSGSVTNLCLHYDVTNEKFGLRWGAGSTEWQTGTTPLGTWATVQIRARMNSSVYHAEWWIDTGTGDGLQASPGDLTGQGASGVIVPSLGSDLSQTATFYYDDWVYTRYYAAFPLGIHRVTLLVPETTGATVSGTASNFNRFTSNGTLAAVNGTEGALLDEVPPTISASSDGVVQVSVAASDYLNLPMSTYTLADNEIIAGVRFLASLWGGTGSGTGTLGWRGHDGTSETTFIAASASYDADSLTTGSASYPLWYTTMWSGGVNGAWTQTRLNAAAVRMGFSTDATPDMGASAVYLEVAVREVATFVRHRLVDGEDPDSDPDATVEEGLHPYNSGERFFRVTNNHPTLSVTFRFYESGGEHASSPVVLAPSDPPEDVVIGAESHGGTVVNTEFGWS